MLRDFVKSKQDRVVLVIVLLVLLAVIAFVGVRTLTDPQWMRDLFHLTARIIARMFGQGRRDHQAP